MDAVLGILSRGVEELLGRAGGPLHVRLVFMPSVVTFLAIRAGMRDAREGHAPFLWGILAKRAERGRLFRSALKDIGTIMIVAVVLDTTYQVVVLRGLFPVQLLVVVVVCTIAPYVLIRGPVTRLTRVLRRNQGGPAGGSPAGTPPDTGRRE